MNSKNAFKNHREHRDKQSSCPTFAATVWLQFLPRCCLAQTKNTMPAAHRLTLIPLTMGFTGAKFRKRNIGRDGIRNAAMMADKRPKLTDFRR
jgi:hypothetical protein